MFVSAAQGAPHPASDAELSLHRRLAADSELGALFAYNQRIATRYESAPTVDLVWEEGKLVIEIDGDDHVVETQQLSGPEIIAIAARA